MVEHFEGRGICLQAGNLTKIFVPLAFLALMYKFYRPISKYGGSGITFTYLEILLLAIALLFAWSVIPALFMKIEIYEEKPLYWVIKKPRYFLIFPIGYETERVYGKIKEIKAVKTGLLNLKKTASLKLIFQTGKEVNTAPSHFVLADSLVNCFSVSRETFEWIGRELEVPATWFE